MNSLQELWVWYNTLEDRRGKMEERKWWFEVFKPWLDFELWKEERRRRENVRVNVDFDRQFEEMKSDTWEGSTTDSVSSPESVSGGSPDKGIVLGVT